MRKTWIALLLTTLLLGAMALAHAEDFGQLITHFVVPRGTVEPNGDAYGVSGPTRGVTCVEYTWTLSVEGEYQVIVGVLDGTYPDTEDGRPVANTHHKKSISGNSFRYTFYEPGDYILFFSDADGIMQYPRITITEGSGANPLTDKVAEIASSCTGGTDWDTAWNVYRWLADNTSYDYTFTYYSPDALLLNGSSVCNGYSYAYELILKKAGIPVRRVVGDTDSGLHAWNVMQLDGEWFQVDPTWNNTNTYFGLDDRTMGYDHYAENTTGGAVECNSLAANYYIHTGEWRLAGKDDIASMQERIASMEDDTVSVKLGDRLYLTENSCMLIGDNLRHMFFLGNVLSYAFDHDEAWRSANGASGLHFFYDEDTTSVIAERQYVIPDGGTLELPKNLQEVGESAFAGTNAVTVVVPWGCQRIAAGAFADSSVRLVKVWDPDTAIEDGAFGDITGVVIEASPYSKARLFAENSPGVVWKPIGNDPEGE